MRIDVLKIYRLLILLSVLLIHADGSFAQSSTKNYVQTKTFLDDAGSTFLRHIDYYDELGYVAETIDVGVNTTQTPIVSLTGYNVRLKPQWQWVPVPSTGLDYVAKWKKKFDHESQDCPDQGTVM